MPKENKKRGRGWHKKDDRRRDLEDDRHHVGPDRPDKRQRLDTTIGHDEVVLDVPAGSPNDDGAGNRPDGTHFFGLLDEDDQSYFKRADAMLELDQFADAEERSLFLATVWKEADGKELKLANSQSCSRALERLVKGSTAAQLRGLWGHFAGHLLTLVQHRFASHCVEALFLTSAPLVTAELIGNVPAEDGASMEDLFLGAVEELKGNLGYLMTDSFASHALRVLLLVLSGRPLSGVGTTSLLQSKKKERIDASTREPRSSVITHGQRTVPESFKKALGEMVSGTLTGLDTNYVRALATNPLANPVLQLLVELEFADSGKQKAKDEKSLFRKLLPDDPPEEGTQSAVFVKGLLYDPVGSRLLETVLQFAPGKTFRTLYRTLFRDKIASLAKNDIAGHVMNRVLERLSRDDLQHSVQQICPEIPALFERSRISVIRTLVDRCQVREIDTQPIADAFGATFGKAESEVLTKMLRPNADDGSVAKEREGRTDSGQDGAKLHTSLLAQAMLSAPGPLRELLTDSLLACNTDTLVLLAKDRTATHVLQKSLTCVDQSLPFRRKMLQQLIESVTVLALDPIGSHVVDIMWQASEGMQFLRERIAGELGANEVQLRESFSGRAVWRNWMMDLHKRRKTEWIARSKGADTEPASIADATPAKAKSGIELAREKFAARQSGRRPHSSSSFPKQQQQHRSTGAVAS